MAKHVGLEDCGGAGMPPPVLPQGQHLVAARPPYRLSTVGVQQ
jgi:hypothetical protein